MPFDVTQDFPVDFDRLWTVLGQTDYIEHKYAALGSTALQLLHFSADAHAIEVELQRQAPVARGELPRWARLLAGKQQTLRHHTRWQRQGPGRADVALDVRALGLHLAAHGTGVVAEIEPSHSRLMLHVTVSAPGLPAAVAQLFEQQVQAALQADHDFTLGYLAAASGGRQRSR